MIFKEGWLEDIITGEVLSNVLPIDTNAVTRFTILQACKGTRLHFRFISEDKQLASDTQPKANEFLKPGDFIDVTLKIRWVS